MEEYKKLEKLCSDMYSGKNGVGEYLSQMLYEDRTGKARVPTWESDHKTLKHIRSLGSKIARDPGPTPLSRQSDLDYVIDFHERILEGKDPLSELRNVRKADRDGSTFLEKEARKAAERARTVSSKPGAARKPHRSHGCVFGLIGIGIIVLILIILFANK